MTTVSVAALEGGRQLRRRKETHISMSPTTQGIMDAKPSKKKSVKAAASGSPTDDDVGPGFSRGESLESDLEARLWNLDKLDQLTTLTVVELRGLMKHISRPTAGRKEELIGEVKRWLAERQTFSTRQTKADIVRATREPSSDADSLEGALLKAEKKSRQSDAISRMTEISSASDLNETLMEKKPKKVEFQSLKGEGDHSLSNGQAIPSASVAAQSRKVEIVRSGRKASNAGKDEEVKPGAIHKDTAVDELSEHSEEEEVTVKEQVTTVKASVTGQKRKSQVSKSITQSKKEKPSEKELEISAKEPWTRLVHKKPRTDWVAYNPETMRPPPPPAGTKTMKLISWNVNGLRAVMKDKEKKAEDGLLMTQLAKEEDFDVLCLQETKLQEKDVELIRKSLLPDYTDTFWSCSTAKPGYSGTAVLSRVKPISVKYGMGLADHDSEGRLITVEFDSFFLVTSYVPNAGDKLVRLSYRTEEWDPALAQYVKELEKQKPVVLTGDLNCSNEEIDIHNPDGNRRNAGFTDEERASFKDNFLNKGLVDTLRLQHPNVVAYTYWGYRFQCRAKNMGWRLDYFLVSEGLVEQVHDSYIRPDVLGSDHCPIGLVLKV